MSLLPDKELLAVEAWFSDLKEALGVSPKTDRGRVLASVRKLVGDNETYEQEKRVVTKALGYSRWGDLYTYAKGKLEATPEVELPEVFYKVPNGWVLRKGALLTYDKAEQQLVKTLRRVKEAWAYIEAEVANGVEEPAWAEEQKAFFVELFENSEEPEEVELSCLAFVRGVEEEDPATTWVEVAGEAAAVMERNYDLPVVLVRELLSYAEAEGVKATKKTVEVAREKLSPAGYWLDHLLTAYLYKNNEPEGEWVTRVSGLFLEATDYAGCFELVSANDPDRPNFTKRSYNPNLTLAQVAAAVRKLAELKEEDLNATRDEVADAVKAALDAAAGEQGATATA